MGDRGPDDAPRHSPEQARLRVHREVVVVRERIAGFGIPRLQAVPAFHTQSGRQRQPFCQRDMILARQGPCFILDGIPRVAHVVFTVNILLVVRGHAQLMPLANLSAPLQRTAKRIVVIYARPRGTLGLRGVGIVVKRLHGVFVGVVIDPRLEVARLANRFVPDGIDAVFDPIRVAPITRKHARVVPGIGRQPFFTILPDKANCQLILTPARGPARLGHDLDVTAVRVFARAAVFSCHRFEVIRQPEIIPFAPRHARQGVAILPKQPGPHGALPPLAAGGAGPHIQLFRLGGPAAQHIDRAAQRIRPVQHRAIPLGQRQLRSAKHIQAAHVHIAVVGHINGDAVNEQRHLPCIETAHRRHDFVTPAHAGQRHPRRQRQRAGQVATVLQLGLITLHFGGGADARRLGHAHHHHFAQRHHRLAGGALAVHRQRPPQQHPHD